MRGRKPRLAQQQGGRPGPRRAIREAGAGNRCAAKPPNDTLKTGPNVNFMLGIVYQKTFFLTLCVYVCTCVGRKLKRTHSHGQG